MSNAVSIIAHPFHDVNFQTYFIDGIPMWSLSDIESALSYEKRGNLKDNIRSRWGNEFKDGEIVTIDGEKLQEFKLSRSLRDGSSCC